MTKHILEFWFDFGSNYSYLTAMRIEALAAERGVTIEWRPFLLGPIFQSLGWASSPFVVQEAKGRYVWQDMARQATKYGLPWTKPTEFPRRGILPARLALAAAGQPWLGAFCRGVFALNFAQDRSMEDPSAMAGLLSSLGADADAYLTRAQTPEIKSALRDATERAQGLGVFGAPTFFVGGDMYWGNDRLEDALAAAGG